MAPVQTDPTVAFEFIATSSFKVLRRPLGSALYVSSKYTERLVQAGVEPSVGSVGDSYDNALAKTINGLYKAEIIHRRGPWRVRFKATTDPNRSYKQDWVHGSSTNRPLPIVRAEHFLAHFKNAPHFIVFKRRAAGRTPSVSALSACKQD